MQQTQTVEKIIDAPIEQTIINHQTPSIDLQKEELKIELLPEKPMTPQKRNIVRKIKKYRQLFPKYLESLFDYLDEKPLSHLTDEELKNVLNDIKNEIRFNKNISSYSKLIYGGVFAYEKFVSSIPFLSMNLDGFTDSLMKDEDFDDDLKEFLMEYEDQFISSPQLNFIMSFVGKSFMFAKNKKQKLDIENIKLPSKKIKTEDIDKYKDL